MSQSQVLENATVQAAFAELSTALIADACLRAGMPLRLLPQQLRSLLPGTRFGGRALPVRHAGSVDIFLEALSGAAPGDVVAIDNGGRTDEACIGDLVALELQAAGVAGVVIWGCHRDTAELTAIGLPVISLGGYPAGPQAVRAREAEALQSARLGAVLVSRTDFLFADADGVVAVDQAAIDSVLDAARGIAAAERVQAGAARLGTGLRAQLDFAAYLARRAADPSYTFRDHLRRLGGAIEV